MTSWDDWLAHQPELKTARLVLRRPGEADVASIVELANDWDVVRRLGRLPHPYGLADARYFLEAVVPRELCWAITDRTARAVLGVVGLRPEGDAAELGYWLGRRHWGQGIATEAAAAVVRTAFDDLGLARLVAGHFADNPASGRVLGKLGFVETGRGERPCQALGRSVPSVELELPAPTAARARAG
jgi:RimJ/RimL family protein N-acetyltransferase